MEEKSKTDPIDLFLTEQQTLTAVERFSEMHEKGKIPQQEKYYKALLPGQPPKAGQQYAFEVDLDRCSGCKACIAGCHSRNGLDDGEMWRNVGLIHGENKFTPLLPLKASEVLLGSTVLEVEQEKRYHPPKECKSDSLSSGERKPELLRLYFQQHVTTACHHCLDPACLNGCPVKAYEKDPNTGIVRHLDDQCIGCRYCVYKCPYGVPQYNKARGIVRKCDMCTERLKEGEAPACVQSCPNEAIRITVVDRADVASQPGKNFKIPSSPDPGYTLPTTVYKTSRLIPEAVLPADHGLLLPQPAEIPLVLMLILTQASVGIYIFSSLLPGGEILNRIQSWTGLALAALGLASATFHLGRPLYAFRAFLGFRTSWLSREAVFFGIYVKLALIAAILAWRPGVWAASVLGLAGVFSSGMIYFDTPRPGWNSAGTILKFFLTAGILGLSETVFAGSWLKTLPLAPRTLGWILLGLIALKAFIEARDFLHLLDKTDPPLKREAILMIRDLKSVTILRWSAMLGGLLLCASAVLLPQSRPELWGAGFILLLSGECLERHLFFRAVVPPKMPGSVMTHEGIQE